MDPKEIELKIKECVGYLSSFSLFPNPAINNLFEIVKISFDNSIVMAIICDFTKKITFSIEKNQMGIQYACLLFPVDWLYSIEKDKWSEYSIMVYNASKILDYYVGKFFIDKLSVIEARASLWEAEFLKTLCIMNRKFKLNSYQENLLSESDGINEDCYIMPIPRNKMYNIPDKVWSYN